MRDDSLLRFAGRAVVRRLGFRVIQAGEGLVSLGEFLWDWGFAPVLRHELREARADHLRGPIRPTFEGLEKPPGWPSRFGDGDPE